MKHLAALVIGIAVSMPALAATTGGGGHEHMKHEKIMGAVVSVDHEKATFVLKTKEGASVPISTDESTKFYRGDAKASVHDLSVGANVVVVAMDGAGNTKAAMEVRLPETKPGAPPTK